MGRKKWRRIPGSMEHAEQLLHERHPELSDILLHLGHYGAEVGLRLKEIDRLKRFVSKVKGKGNKAHEPLWSGLPALPTLITGIFEPGEEPMLRSLSDLPQVSGRVKEAWEDFLRAFEECEQVLADVKPVIEVAGGLPELPAYLMAGFATFVTARVPNLNLSATDFTLLEVATTLLDPFDTDQVGKPKSEMAEDNYVRRVDAWRKKLPTVVRVSKLLLATNTSGTPKKWRDAEGEDWFGQPVPYPPKPKKPSKA